MHTEEQKRGGPDTISIVTFMAGLAFFVIWPFVGAIAPEMIAYPFGVVGFVLMTLATIWKARS